MNKIEVERKRKLDAQNHDELIVKLEKLGYEKVSEDAETDLYFSRPDVDYMKTVECLRVRLKKGFSEVTYKPASSVETHSKDNVISKRETNVQLFDTAQAEEAIELLKNIGMIELAEVAKQRTTYKALEYPQLTIAIDEVKNAGIFVEVEVMAPNIDESKKLLEKIEAQLSITTLEIVSLPYRDLVMETI